MFSGIPGYQEIEDEIHDFVHQNKGESVWYRGEQAQYPKMSPSLTRILTTDLTSSSSNKLPMNRVSLALNYEKWQYKKLYERGTHVHPSGYQKHELTDWDIPYFAQHYGLPTRFLDWTTNLNTALYFACQSAESNTNNPCLWLLDPAKFNDYSVNNNSILYTSRNYNEFINQTEYRHRQQNPVALSPSYCISNPRLYLQNGYFIYTGSHIDMVRFINEADNTEEIMHKIIIPNQIAKEIAKLNPITAETLELDEENHLTEIYSFERFLATSQP